MLKNLEFKQKLFIYLLDYQISCPCSGNRHSTKADQCSENWGALCGCGCYVQCAIIEDNLQGKYFTRTE